MAQAFDIRFARSAGWKALLEVPTNSFRWKGGGLLSIDADGISIAVKRGLLTWFTRTRSRRIAASRLTDVYREGEALRLEFSTPHAARTVLPFWVGNRDIAAQIVRLLPTLRTVELEHSTVRSACDQGFDWRLAAWALAGVVTVGLGALALPRLLAGAPVQAPATTRSMPVAPPPAPPPPLAQHAPAVSAPVQLGPPLPLAASAYLVDEAPSSAPVAPSAAGSKADVSPLGWSMRGLGSARVMAGLPGASGYAVARRQVATFEAESAALRADYLDFRDAPTAERLKALDDRWWKLTLRIYQSEEMQDPGLGRLCEIELAVARSWHSFLSSYAEGLRMENTALIATAFAELRFAESLAARVPQYVP